MAKGRRALGPFKMSEAILTSMLTIVAGTLIFVIGQLLLRFWIEPVHDLRSHIGRIAHLLIYHADVYCHVGMAEKKQARTTVREIRNCASELLARSSMVTWYGFWQRFHVVPERDKVYLAHGELIGLSNCVLGEEDENVNAQYSAYNKARIPRIRRYLRLPEEMLGDMC